MTKLDSLQELALRATPGPWEHYQNHNAVHALTQTDFGPGFKNICGMHDGGQTRESIDANAEYIAACSPDVVLSLIATVRALTSDIPTDNVHIESSCGYCHFLEPYSKQEHAEDCVWLKAKEEWGL